MSEPSLIKAGDKRVLLNGVPPKVDCLVVAEDKWKEINNNIEYLNSELGRERKLRQDAEDALIKLSKKLVSQGRFTPDELELLRHKDEVVKLRKLGMLRQKDEVFVMPRKPTHPFNTIWEPDKIEIRKGVGNE